MDKADIESGVAMILNGTATSLPRDVTMDQLVQVAFPDVVRTDLIEWEVDYEYAGNPGVCELHKGDVLHVGREMTINVTYTDKS